MAKIDGYYILAEKEDSVLDVDITQQPVEKGIDVSDHVQRKARTLSISGVVSGDKAAETHQFLIESQDNGKIVNYVGRTTMKGLLSDLSTSRDYRTANGFTYSLTITEILIANSSFVSKLPLPVKAQAAKIVNSGVKQTKSKKKDGKKTTKKKTKAKVKKVKKVKKDKGAIWRA
ncbi:phage baseplate protein [Paenibacillus pini]|uniref:Dit-like phage tail protein N-terminal domain-containing protein n=1 Tax=Paenibacillus pini JCM 16418 TaxID=1236976 RepID=W7YWS0_9BACL|nr:hypothetical protein [Paenibacillus pini]GAF06824.1 hypothetical protein JCM16418_806 [Paenibacillus pini JCM 16418]